MTTYLSLIVLLVGVGLNSSGSPGFEICITIQLLFIFPDWTSSCWDLVLWEEVRLLGG